jgi:hypothetical protein
VPKTRAQSVSNVPLLNRTALQLSVSPTARTRTQRLSLAGPQKVHNLVDMAHELMFKHQSAAAMLGDMQLARVVLVLREALARWARMLQPAAGPHGPTDRNAESCASWSRSTKKDSWNFALRWAGSAAVRRDWPARSPVQVSRAAANALLRYYGWITDGQPLSALLIPDSELEKLRASAVDQSDAANPVAARPVPMLAWPERRVGRYGSSARRRRRRLTQRDS